MKKIFLATFCSLLVFNPVLYLDATSNEDAQDNEAFFKDHMNQLIQIVTSKKESKKYSDRDMNSFLLVAIALKNGIPDVKDIEMALSLFEIVKTTATNESLREMAEGGMRDIKTNL